MKSLNKKILLSVLTFVFFFGPILAAHALNVDNPGGAFPGTDLNTIVDRVISFITGFVATLSIIFLVYGGIIYVTAGGDESRMETAKNTIIYAILGLFVAGVAYAATKLIINTIINKE